MNCPECDTEMFREGEWWICPKCGNEIYEPYEASDYPLDAIVIEQVVLVPAWKLIKPGYSSFWEML